MQAVGPPWEIDFNPRAPCGARLFAARASVCSLVFQSTRPVRGATCRQTASDSLVGFQSTRPVRGATAVVMAGVFDFAISIHAPRAGRDYFLNKSWLQKLHISIHAPRAGRDARDGPPSTGGRISIHAPRAGRDSCRSSWRSRHTDFNPRAPCGARPHILPDAVFQFGFQSTRPVRGATGCIIGP